MDSQNSNRMLHDIAPSPVTLHDAIRPGKERVKPDEEEKEAACSCSPIPSCLRWRFILASLASSSAVKSGPMAELGSSPGSRPSNNLSSSSAQHTPTTLVQWDLFQSVMLLFSLFLFFLLVVCKSNCLTSFSAQRLPPTILFLCHLHKESLPQVTAWSSPHPNATGSTLIKDIL